MKGCVVDTGWGIIVDLNASRYGTRKNPKFVKVYPSLHVM